jgi:hypothetical protein
MDKFPPPEMKATKVRCSTGEREREQNLLWGVIRCPRARAAQTGYAPAGTMSSSGGSSSRDASGSPGVAASPRARPRIDRSRRAADAADADAATVRALAAAIPRQKTQKTNHPTLDPPKSPNPPKLPGRDGRRPLALRLA